jgi:extradiol dioxygenase family protein
MVNIDVNFYYVGDLHRTTELYAKLLESNPFYAGEDWVRFHLEGGDLALHLDPDRTLTRVGAPVRFGAVVSLTVEDIQTFLRLALSLGFTVAGEVQDLP